MHLHLQTFTVNKRVPLTISRGTTAQNTNILLRLEHNGIEGWGEAVPFSIGDHSQPLEELLLKLEAIAPQLKAFSPFEWQRIEHVMDANNLPSAARTAIDLAVHDWLGKQLGVPLWKLWGGDRTRIVPTSVTIGISPPEAARQRLLQWLEIDHFRAIKVKLGNPAGIGADQQMLKAVLEVAPKGAKISVDANGGWNPADAVDMAHWLADLGITYIEQPLPVGQEHYLPVLYRESPLPIFVDESCFNSHSIPPLEGCVHGINIKLMKAGGLREARRMIHTAHACGLQIMFGCYSDSTLANTAAAQLAPFAHHLDLDSHLNLMDDPFIGASLKQGYLLPNDLPGLGVTQRPEPNQTRLN
jgi:L-Ala-D/L-Glu epimerase